MLRNQIIKISSLFFFLFLLSACGSGGGGHENPQSGTDPSATAKASVILPGDPDCVYGGILVETGIDENNNGVLDAREVDNSEKVCNGAPGSDGSSGTDGLNALVNISNEPVGINCTNGGKRIDTGMDANGNDVLDSGEIASTAYTCNGVSGSDGVDGTDGLNALVNISDEPAGRNCANGGQRIHTGMDANGNGVLDSGEIASTDYTCNGANGGLNALVNISDEPAGKFCASGGQRIDSGIDTNGNGVLDSGEIASTAYTCNGASGSDGADGTDGLNALIDMNPEPVGVNCPNGGLRIDVGIDTNGNGSLDPAEITQTGFVCSGSDGSIGWQVATRIEFNTGGDSFAPQVAVDGRDNAVAVWMNDDGTRYNIWANRYVSGFGWGTAQLIEADNAGGASAPQVAVDGNGNAVAVWYQDDGTRGNIWANRYVAGTSWGTAELIETDNVGNAGPPQVAVDDSGNAVAVWHQDDGTRYNIWANHYVPGFGWGTAQLIETDNAGGASGPQVAVNGSGNAVAVWVQSDGTRNNIWANRYVLGTGWGTAGLIETENVGFVLYPQVAVDGSGNAVAVWQRHGGVFYNIWANRYVLGTGWGTAELIETGDSGDANWPQVAVDGSGNAVAVWQHHDGVFANILANRYVVGTGWGTVELIETQNLVSTGSPQVAVDGSGNAVAVWDQQSGTGHNNIWANRYIPGLGWGTAELVETNDLGHAESPQVSVNSSGNAVAVWPHRDSTRYNIWANRRQVQ